MMEGALRTIFLLFLDRFTEIERENRLLLEKMTNIMHKNRGQMSGLDVSKFFLLS